MKKILIIAICLNFVLIFPCFAKEHTLEMGTEISHIKYEEPGLMEEDGIMYGIVSSYTYRGKTFLPNCMLKVEGKSAWGNLDYSSPISGTIENIPDWLLELRSLAGYDFQVKNNQSLALTITPYLGLGYRYLNDDSSEKISSLGAIGYERESNYFYSPIGIEIITDLKNNWLLGVVAEYDYFWQGLQKSHFDWAGFKELALESKQDKGYGLRGSIKIMKRTEKLDLIAEPYIRYWSIKESAWSILGVEPENNSTEAGLKLAVKF